MPQDGHFNGKISIARRTLLLLGGSAALAACTRSIDLGESFEVDPSTTGSIRPKISVDPQVTNPM